MGQRPVRRRGGPHDGHDHVLALPALLLARERRRERVGLRRVHPRQPAAPDRDRPVGADDHPRDRARVPPAAAGDGHPHGRAVGRLHRGGAVTHRGGGSAQAAHGPDERRGGCGADRVGAHDGLGGPASAGIAERQKRTAPPESSASSDGGVRYGSRHDASRRRPQGRWLGAARRHLDGDVHRRPGRDDAERRDPRHREGLSAPRRPPSSRRWRCIP